MVVISALSAIYVALSLSIRIALGSIAIGNFDSLYTIVVSKIVVLSSANELFYHGRQCLAKAVLARLCSHLALSSHLHTISHIDQLEEIL